MLFNNGVMTLSDDELVYEIEFEIKNADGLHMRPAMQFVDVAGKFECDITVTNKKTTVDAKSIMQMTMLAATYGTKLKVRAQGVGAKEAVDELQRLVEQDLFDDKSEVVDGTK